MQSEVKGSTYELSRQSALYPEHKTNVKGTSDNSCVRAIICQLPKCMYHSDTRRELKIYDMFACV